MRRRWGERRTYFRRTGSQQRGRESSNRWRWREGRPSRGYGQDDISTRMRDPLADLPPGLRTDPPHPERFMGLLRRYRRGRNQNSGAILFDRARLHVVHVAWGKDIVGLFPGLIHTGIVVYGNLPLSDHLEPIPIHNDRCAFRQADSEQIGILPDHRNDVVPRSEERRV